MLRIIEGVRLSPFGDIRNNAASKKGGSGQPREAVRYQPDKFGLASCPGLDQGPLAISSCRDERNIKARGDVFQRKTIGKKHGQPRLRSAEAKRLHAEIDRAGRQWLRRPGQIDDERHRIECLSSNHIRSAPYHQADGGAAIIGVKGLQGQVCRACHPAKSGTKGVLR